MLFQSFYKCICCFLLFSCSVVSNSFATPWTIDHQAPLSMGFPRQEFWGGLPFPSAGDLPGPGIKPPSPELAGAFFAMEPHGTPICSFILSTTIYWGPLLPVLLGICGIKQKQWQTTLSSWRSHSTEWSQKINKLLQYIMLSGEPCLRETEAGEEIRECEGGKWGLSCIKVLRKILFERPLGGGEVVSHVWLKSF